MQRQGRGRGARIANGSATSAADPDGRHTELRNRPKRKLTFRSWIERTLFLFDVTMVPYMLDWWERLIVRMVVLISLWFICYKSSHFAIWCYEELGRKLGMDSGAAS